MLGNTEWNVWNEIPHVTGPRMWNVGISIVMPEHAVFVEAETEDEAVKRALRMLNEAGCIPENGTCDVHAEEL